MSDDMQHTICDYLCNIFDFGITSEFLNWIDSSLELGHLIEIINLEVITTAETKGISGSNICRKLKAINGEI